MPHRLTRPTHLFMVLAQSWEDNHGQAADTARLLLGLHAVECIAKTRRGPASVFLTVRWQ
jgi:hypothetical protein